MNVWYVISLIIVGVGVLALVGLILASIFSILKIVNQISFTLNRMQEQQMNPLQTQLALLNGTVNRIKVDVDQMKNDVTNVTECFKDVGKNIQALSSSSRLRTKEVVEKVKNDPTMQAQTEELTSNALRFLKRYA